MRSREGEEEKDREKKKKKRHFLFYFVLFEIIDEAGSDGRWVELDYS